LNRHSRLLGNDPSSADSQRLRGQRVFCSNRGRRKGCGRTFPFFLADTLPRHTFTAPLAWSLLAAFLKGLCLKAAVEETRIPFALESAYRLLARLRLRLDALRSLLSLRAHPPPGLHVDPLRHTLEHLRHAFVGEVCPVAALQLDSGAPFMG
jgi:hypothetical protein